MAPASGARRRPEWGWVAFFAAAAACNVALAAALGSGRATAAVAVAILPLALLSFGALLAGRQHLLVLAALSLNFTNLELLNEPLPFAGGIALYASDVVLMVALAAWTVEVARRRDPVERPARPLAAGWPLALLAAFIAVGVVRGHLNYGTPLFGQPVRLIAYAVIAVAIGRTSAANLWKGITTVMYGGAVLQLVLALLNLATGGSQTDSLSLSTGGTRILALSSAIYLTGSLVCALLNLELAEDRFSAQLGHAVIAGIATFGIVVAFGRTTYAAVAVILPVLLLGRPRLRRSLGALLPLLLPALIAIVLVIPTVKPDLVETLQARISASPATDINVEWRSRGREIALHGIGDHLLTGFGFGRPIRFEFLGLQQDLTGDPHNSFVYVLAGGGVLALGALLLLAGAFVYDACRRLRRARGAERPLLVWALGLWFAFMVNAFYGPVLSDATMLLTIWALMVVPGAVPLRRHGQAPATAPPAV